ncbi:MAG: hypothetical protein K9H64_09935 [Bacteroidales bacterium]|nr:hypothetical protein [Bacteroidales bacterium]MCF8456187.1 hypothetical protein [Bacteroidales bacterium]
MGNSLLKFFIFFLVVIATASCQKERILEVQTLAPTQDGSTYIAQGVLVDMGEASEVKHGFVINDKPEPTIMNGWDYNLYFRNQIGDFSVELDWLDANKEYFIRSFAMDGSLMKYGNEVSFMTSDTAIHLVTGIPEIIDESTVQVNGSIENLGSLRIYDFGQCWADNEFPTIDNLHISYDYCWCDTSFTNTISGLSLQTQYWVRTYCRTSDNNYLYGNSQPVFIPDLLISTDTLTLNANQTATLQGTIVSIGINPIVEHGHCWSVTTAFPDYNANRISIGTASQTGIFYTTLPDLESGEIYYYRAYASNGQYVKYGLVKSFTAN